MESKFLLPVLASYVLLSLLSFAAYAIDKSAARKGKWRISEAICICWIFSVVGQAGGWRKKSCDIKPARFPSSVFIGPLCFCIALAWLGYCRLTARMRCTRWEMADRIFVRCYAIFRISTIGKAVPAR